MRLQAATCLVCLLVASASAAREYRIVNGYDIPGNDLAGKGGSKYTKVCVPPSGGYKGKSGFDAYKLYCDDTPGCVAAVAPRAPDGCAYLKSKGDRGAMKADPKWVVVTSAEKPQKACTFSNLGGPCTTDPWVDQPICCGGNKNPCMNGVCVSGYPSGRPRTYRFVNGHDIPGNDIASNGEPFTKVCVPAGGYKGKYGRDGLQQFCDERPGCAAVVEAGESCGYLKTKGARADIKPNAKFGVLTTQEPPQKACVFSNIGGACTSDPWVEQPLCCGGNKVKCAGGKCESSYPSGHRMA